jgi:hypothetical protein
VPRACVRAAPDLGWRMVVEGRVRDLNRRMETATASSWLVQVVHALPTFTRDLTVTPASCGRACMDSAICVLSSCLCSCLFHVNCTLSHHSLGFIVMLCVLSSSVRSRFYLFLRGHWLPCACAGGYCSDSIFICAFIRTSSW